MRCWNSLEVFPRSIFGQKGLWNPGTKSGSSPGAPGKQAPIQTCVGHAVPDGGGMSPVKLSVDHSAGQPMRDHASCGCSCSGLFGVIHHPDMVDIMKNMMVTQLQQPTAAAA